MDDLNLLGELIKFLDDEKQEVRQLAIQHLLGFTKSDEAVDYILSLDINPIQKCYLEVSSIAHDAFKVLINITARMGEKVEKTSLVDLKFVHILITLILDPDYIFADLACMLLSNLTKCEKISDHIGSTPLILQGLVEAFCLESFNPKANLDFLASVFSDISLKSYTGKSHFLDENLGIPLKSLLPFTRHKSVIRRGGAISTIKNCLVLSEFHSCFFDETVPILVPVLLPLAGPEDLSDEDMEGMPEELQFLEADKTREPLPELRIQLLDILILLTMTCEGRDYLRKMKAYPIIREMHLAETDERCVEAAERLVNMLMRDETTGK